MKIARTLACSLLALAGALATALPAAADPPTAGQDESVGLYSEIIPGYIGIVGVSWEPSGNTATSGPTQITLDVPAGLKIIDALMYSMPYDYTWAQTLSPDGQHFTATFTGLRQPGHSDFMKVHVWAPKTVPAGVITATVSHRNDVNPTNNVASTTTTGTALTPVIPPAPRVHKVDGFFGPGAGGTPVTITGRHLTNAMVLFGDTPATSATCTDTSCTATSPGGLGVVPVRVVTPGGTDDFASVFGYYGPPPVVPAPAVSTVYIKSGPAAGGTTVYLAGSNLAGGRLYFGGVPGTDNSCGTSFCDATAPAGTGTVDVTVVTPGGASPTVSADQYTYTG
ncbi:IPT/TIG domain-containing protein [Kitasatospora sp. LaBMicrA B282]|uniref:IPT/TIG domain-containing protein n=1 Tax=Kitasatospora sp. LaBMicrA B282 TaxID=3420949 RepID=UPI003D12DECD